MIAVSSISEFVYCPAKMYLNQFQGIEVQTNQMIHGKFVHEVRRGYEEITKHTLAENEEYICLKMPIK